MEHQYWIYMMGSANGRVLYIGMTNDIARRVLEHKTGVLTGFTRKYCCYHLLYYEQYNDVRAVITREKQLKGWLREKKEQLIASINPKREDMAADWDIDSSLRSE